MKRKPVTGKICSKPYACGNCGYVQQHSTNHWGPFYATRCPNCEEYATWHCQEECPPTHDLPAPWKTVRLGDIAEVK